MDAINMNLVGMDLALGNSDKSPLDSEGFSKAYNRAMKEGNKSADKVTDKEVDGEELVSYLLDPTVFNMVRMDDYLNIDLEETVSNLGLDGLLGNTMEDDLAKIDSKLQGQSLDNDELSMFAELELGDKLGEMNLEHGKDLESGSLKAEDSKMKSFMEPLGSTDTDKSLSDLDKVFKLDELKEDLSSNLKEEEMKTEGKFINKKSEAEAKSFTLEDMQNSLRKIEVKPIDSNELKVADLSQDNLEIFQDSIVELMEIRSQGEDSTMNVKLIPKELGSIDISLRMEEGKLVAKIVVENEQARQMFSSNIKLLNQSLQRQDITIEKIQIDLDLNNNPGSNDGEQRQGQKSFRRNNFRFEESKNFAEIPIKARGIEGLGMSILA